MTGGVHRAPARGEPSVLWLSTKAPAPEKDGGSWAQWLQIEALRAAGAEVTVIAPASPHRKSGAIVRALLRGFPAPVATHFDLEVSRGVATALRRRSYDVLHVEQSQALVNAGAARHARLPIVLREQNLEIDLWTERLLRWRVPATLAARVRERWCRWQRRAWRTCDAVVALTSTDASRIASASGGTCHCIPQAFPASLPSGRLRLHGTPAVTLIGSPGWWPNVDAARWCATEVWPAVRDVLPGAILHVIGAGAAAFEAAGGVVVHGSQFMARDAFPAGGILLAITRSPATGIRMKALEAWARGVAVVGTRTAMEGSGRPQVEYLRGDDVPGIVAAVKRIHEEPSERARLLTNGRSWLSAIHDPATSAGALMATYASVCNQRGAAALASSQRNPVLSAAAPAVAREPAVLERLA